MEKFVCNDCNEEKPRSEFYFQCDGKYLRQPCKPCHLIKCQEYRSRPGRIERARESAKYSAIKVKYGISKQDYLLMIANGCEICGSMDQLAVDHDHNCCPGKKTCGECVRGLLCKRHNWAAGNLNDSAEEALAMFEYLKKSRVAV